MLELSILIAILVIIIYVWLTWNYNHWKNLDIPYLEPALLFGNIKDFVLMKKCQGIVYEDLYRQGSEPALGIFSMRQPQLLIRDPALLKIITTNEFSSFQQNDNYVEPSDFFFNTNIFFYSGPRWKKNRGILTQALSMAKLKQFVPHIVDVGGEMIKYLNENTDKEFEAKSFSGLFTTETAMSYVYGIKCNTYKDPNSIYRQVFNELFSPSWWNGFKFAVANAFPSVGHFFKIGITSKKFIDFYMNVITETVDYRKKNNVSRNDFLQFLMEKSATEAEISIYDMLGLSMNIVGDATETTSAGLTMVMDALTRYPEEQAKLRQEIDSKIKSFEDITYENISSLSYLQAFISESLRIVTPVPLLEKKCTADCTISYEGKEYIFKKGDKIALSMSGIHKNPQYFPSPDQFKPERYLNSSEQVDLFSFGSGPRACIGRSLAHIMMKVFLCSLLKHFEVLPRGKVAPDIDFEINSTFFLMIKGGVWFRVKKR